MLKQGRKFILLFTAIVILNSTVISAFEYDTSSLREEITETSIHIYLEEGNYHLVIDNTGYVSGDYNREDSFVELEIFAVDGEPAYTSDSRNLGDFVYWDIPISTDTFLFFTIYFIFNITATKPVTVFLTDEEGFLDFEEEVQNFDFREPISAFLIIGIILGSIVVLGISAGLIEKIRRKYGFMKPAQTEKLEEIVVAEEPAKLGKVKVLFYYCELCEEEFIDKTKTCSRCGSKLKKIKKEIAEIE
ncbi:MAG: hypothetical protein KGD64_03045 [Candidatus Heimdallarchaeota archaeon]|nr:hypothetical protein [Candidatus Heimdallarchaeota archaeon]